jgi:hypothetical protein
VVDDEFSERRIYSAKIWRAHLQMCRKFSAVLEHCPPKLFANHYSPSMGGQGKLRSRKVLMASIIKAMSALLSAPKIVVPSVFDFRLRLDDADASCGRNNVKVGRKQNWRCRNSAFEE